MIHIGKRAKRVDEHLIRDSSRGGVMRRWDKETRYEPQGKSASRANTRMILIPLLLDAISS